MNLDAVALSRRPAELSDFFDEIWARVKQDFDDANNVTGVTGFIVIDGLGDNNVLWDTTINGHDLGTADFSSTNPSSMTAALANTDGLGRVAREFKAGQVLNNGNPKYGLKASVSAALFTAGAIQNDLKPDLSRAANVDPLNLASNTIVHELAHTFGLPEGYKGVSAINLLPYDVMEVVSLIPEGRTSRSATGTTACCRRRLERMTLRADNPSRRLTSSSTIFAMKIRHHTN